MDGHFFARVGVLVVLCLAATGSCRSPRTTDGGPKAPVAVRTVPSTPSPATNDGVGKKPAASPIADQEPPLPPWLSGRQTPETELALQGPQVVQSPSGVVTSVESQATQAGIEMLEKGGNAIDAAVATAFALAVTHPSAGNLGGGGFMLLKKGNQVDAVDFRENSPAALTDESFWEMIKKAGGVGPASVGVPGTVAGLHLAHQKHGKLPWAALLEPAIELATEGYRLGARQRKTIGWSAAVLRYDPVAKEALLKSGAAPPLDSVIKRPRLALALERIRDEGPEGFYQGPTARDIVDSLGERGLMTLEDLDKYRARLREPLFLAYRGYRVITMPPPSAGGVAVMQNLAMLEALKAHERPPLSPERLHLIAEASRRAQTERRLFVVAPEGWPTERERRGARRRWTDAGTWLAAHPVDPEEATPSSSLHPLYEQSVKELEHTTHLSVVDAEGHAVSCTVTLSGSFGSRVFTEETGIALNNSVASFSSVGHNTPAAARRTVSSMSPTLVLGADDTLLVLGSPGGDTIPSTVSEVLFRLVNDEATLHEAVEIPRFHQGFVPDQLWTERKRPLPAKVVAKLRKMGHRVVAGRRTIGDANIAAFFEGQALAVADTREGGLAASPSPSAPSSKQERKKKDASPEPSNDHQAQSQPKPDRP